MNRSNSNNKGSKIKHQGMKKSTAGILLGLFVVLMILAGVFAFVSLDNGELGTTDYKAYASNIKLGLDIKGGVSAVYSVDKASYDKKYLEENDNNDEYLNDSFKSAVEGTVSRLSDLLFSKGFPEAQVTVSGSGDDTKIRVEVPDVEDPEEIFNLIAKPAALTMYEVDASGEKVAGQDQPYILGSDIEMANVGQQEGKFVIQLKFTKEGAKKFADATTKLQGKNLGIFLDGELIMSPKVNAAITNGQAIIEGEYTYDQAYEYATRIQSGSLDVALSLDSSSHISAALGKDAIQYGLIAGGVGLAIIMIIMIARYRMLGVAASLALIFFTFTYLFFMSIFPWVQLTLPGIAGILLSIGMAVDANVIIFERMREIHSTGGDRSIRGSIKESFHDSLSAIIDGNVTTLIGAIVLAIIAVSSIKGFAITLIIGIVISLFTALVVTRLLLACFTAFNSTSNKLYGLTSEEKDYHIDYKNETMEVEAK